MDNNLITKLIKKINFDLADKFELTVAQELSFVPVNMQNDVFFIAIHSGSNKENITKYIQKTMDNRIEFIYLNKENFDLLFEAFLKKYTAKYGGAILSSIQTKKEDINISTDEFDI